MPITRRSLMGLLAAAGSGLLSKPASAFAQTPAPGSETPSDFEHPAGSAIPPGPFQGTRASLKHYEVPEWFRDAKFGMWAHWGPQSAIEDGDWYARNMYIQGSDQYN
ncbi:MAG: alpha-L-fucosidase, partial [Acidobacteriaceae bacterium]